MFLRTIIAWLSRLGWRNGFGVQSPWTYSFVRATIYKSHKGDTALKKFEKSLPHLPYLDRRVGRLCIDICRRNHFHRALIATDSIPFLSHYFHFAHVDKVNDDTWQLAVVSLCFPDNVEKIISQATESSVIILTDITPNKELWEKVVRDYRVGITFDIFICGIILFDHNIYKQHYKLGF